MKRMKKIVSMLLAVVMVLGMSLTVFAEGSYTITINKNAKDTNTHTYNAYQIFKGDLASNPEYEKDKSKQEFILSNIQWGSAIKTDEHDVVSDLITALKKDPSLGDKFADVDAEDSKSAAQVADIIATFASSDENHVKDIDAFAKIVNSVLTNAPVAGTGDTTEDSNKVTIGNLEAGYYMVKDADDQFDAGDKDASYTRLLLQVVGDSQVTVKSTVPSGEKEIFYQGTDAYHNDGKFVPNPNVVLDPELNDSNYASMGDEVVFQITSQVPNYYGYDYYYFIMNDKMGDGLTFNPESVKVKVGDTELKGTIYDKEGETLSAKGTEYYVYTASEQTDGMTFKLAFKDIMETEIVDEEVTQKYPVDTRITLTYTATVNENAIIGSEGNENAWSLDYSRNPNVDADYGKNPENPNPGLPLDTEKEVLGKTPEQKTLTFLTRLDITKYANKVEDNNLLPGAEFTLTGTSYQVVLAGGTKFVKDENGEYYKLKDGTYTKTAPEKDVYNEIGTGDEETTEGYLLAANGKYYVPKDKTEYVGQKIYEHVSGTVDQYADPDQKYSEETVSETEVVEVPVSIKLTTNGDGKISFVGLGEGVYELKETVTPAGYNTIDPITLTIICELPDLEKGEEKCKWTITADNDVTITQQMDNEGNELGIFAADVINVSGALLPSTGGIGTTIFYVAGSILVLLAVVLLVAKKRMSAEK